MKHLLTFCLLLAPLAAAPVQSDFYLREEIPLPQGEVMEIGSVALLPGKNVAVSTRRGDIWICSGAYENDLTKVTWRKFAEGQHEPFGMFWKDGWLWMTQRPEVTRMKDGDGDGIADTFETICSEWGINGDYHEYAFGSDPDRDGNIWITLCLTGSGGAKSDWRGWCVRVTPDGRMIPTCSGIRSPGGIGFNAKGDVFYCDNQGMWNGSSSLKWLKPGSFQGNPTGNHYHKLADLPPPPVPASASRVEAERAKFPEYIPPAVVLPHGKVGQSPTGIVADTTGGKFGPWHEQLYVAEQCHSQIQRVCLEQINGIYQGAVFPFLEGFESGLIPLRLDPGGIIFTGGSNRGWPSRGTKKFTFERVRWSGKVPFEILTMSATPDGFELAFTEPVEQASAADVKNYAMSAWTYILQSGYGSPEVDQVVPTIASATVSADGRKVRLKVDGRVKGHVHHLKLDQIRAASGAGMWHKDAYYTLNEIPK